MCMCPCHSGAALHGLWGIPPSCLHQEPSASDLRGQLRHLRRERWGHGLGEVCGKSGWDWIYCCMCLFKRVHKTTVSVHHHQGSPAWELHFYINQFLIANVSGFGSMGLTVDVKSTSSRRNKRGVWAVAYFTFETWTLAFVGSFYDGTGDEEWMTTCFYEHCFVLWELINDKLHVIYIIGNIADPSSWRTYSECNWECKCQFLN